MRFSVLLLALFAWVGCAHADITKTNFNGLGTAQANVVTPRDIYGNMLDAHDGDIIKYNGRWYWTGETHGSGYRLQTGSTVSGIVVYSSPDMADRSWRYEALLVDPADPSWTGVCASTSGGFGGCFRPRFLGPRVSDGKYVLWISAPAAAGLFDGLAVAICDTPAGPCVRGTDPTHLVHGPSGDYGVFCCDGSGFAYISYDNPSSRAIFVDRLTATLDDSDGVNTVATSVTSGGEGNLIFADAALANWFIIWGASSYDFAQVNYISLTGSNPLGTWGTQGLLNSNGCLTQPSAQHTFVEGGHTTYLYIGDNFIDKANEGLANLYYQPLTISGSTISAFSCNATITIQGITPVSQPSPWPTTDQSNYPSTDEFQQNCDITNTHWVLQTFVPSRSQLDSVGMPLGQNNWASPSCIVSLNGHPCVSPDGSLETDLYTIDGSNNPQTLVSSITTPVASLKWAPQFTILNYAKTLTPGSKYGVLIKPTGNTIGCFSFAHDAPSSSSYPAGLLRVSTDGGSTWTTQTNQSAMFSTFSPLPMPALGTVH